MKFLAVLYQIFIFLPIFLPVTILTALIVIIGSAIGDGNFWGYYPGRIWSRFVCFLSLCPVKVEGYENLDPNTSYMFVANHQGAYDIFLIYGYLGHNFKWMMKKGLRTIPIVGKACDSAGHIFVDDSGAKGILKTIRQAKKVLCNGMSMVVFPEGSRTLDGKIHRFKKGAFQLAKDVNLPVVPLTIEGPYKVLKRGTFWIYPHKLTLKIHKPIPLNLENDSAEEVERLKNEAFKVISSSLTQSVEK